MNKNQRQSHFDAIKSSEEKEEKVNDDDDDSGQKTEQHLKPAHTIFVEIESEYFMIVLRRTTKNATNSLSLSLSLARKLSAMNTDPNVDTYKNGAIPYIVWVV